MTVHREEHFRGYNLSLSCSAAPILDPHGGILGVLDASTANSSDSRLIQRHTMALVNMSAHLISRWNFLSEYGQAWILRFHSRPEFVGLAARSADGDRRRAAISWPSMRVRWCSSGAPTANRWSASRSVDSFSSISRRSNSGRKFEPSAIWPVRDRGSRPALLRHRARTAAQFRRAAATLALPNQPRGGRGRRARARACRRGPRRCARISRAAGSCSRSRCRFCCMGPPAPARRRSPSPCIAAACGRISHS